MVLSHLETTFPDSESVALLALAKSIFQNGICPACQKRINFKADHPDQMQDFHVRPVEIQIPFKKGKK